jgi:NIPSNAP
VLYELRTYHVAPGKLRALHDRFEQHTLRLFAKHGIRPVGFWTTTIGPRANMLTYLLAWESLGERETVWDGFASDPDWLAVKAETESDGALVEWAENSILSPTAYSRLR